MKHLVRENFLMKAASQTINFMDHNFITNKIQNKILLIIILFKKLKSVENFCRGFITERVNGGCRKADFLNLMRELHFKFASN